MLSKFKFTKEKGINRDGKQCCLSSNLQRKRDRNELKCTEITESYRIRAT